MPPLVLERNMEESVICGLRCVIRCPEGFDKNKKYPTLLYLLNKSVKNGQLKKTTSYGRIEIYLP